MNRRNFLRTMIGGVAAAAAVRTFPFRVYSFPSEIQLAQMSLREAFNTGATSAANWLADHRGYFIVQPEWDFFFVRESDAARKQTLFRIDQQ